MARFEAPQRLHSACSAMHRGKVDGSASMIVLLQVSTQQEVYQRRYSVVPREMDCSV